MAVVPTDRQFKGWTHNQVINEVPVPPSRLGEKQDAGSGPGIFAKSEKLAAARAVLCKLADERDEDTEPPFRFRGSRRRGRRGDFEAEFDVDPSLLRRQALQNFYEEMGQHRLMKDLERHGFKFTGFEKFKAKGLDFLKNPVVGMLAPTILSAIPAGKDEYGNPQTMSDTLLGNLLSIGLPLLSLYRGPYKFNDRGVLTGLKAHNMPGHSGR